MGAMGAMGAKGSTGMSGMSAGGPHSRDDFFGGATLSTWLTR